MFKGAAGPTGELQQDGAAPDASSEKRSPRVRPPTLGLDPVYVARGREARAALEASAPDAGAGEKIIYELVARQLALALAVGDAEVEVAARLGYFINEPKNLVAISHALKELTSLSNTIGRRIEGALTTASTLRAQRRLWSLGRS